MDRGSQPRKAIAEALTVAQLDPPGFPNISYKLDLFSEGVWRWTTWA